MFLFDKPAIDLVSCPLFPWKGNKRKVANEIRLILGDLKTYVEPFFGRGSILFARPPVALEVVNDWDCFLVNFWRSTQSQPEIVAQNAARLNAEIDLKAWSSHLQNVRDDLLNNLKDPKWPGDAELAGVWVWSVCASIGLDWKTGSLSHATRGVGVVKPHPLKQKIIPIPMAERKEILLDLFLHFQSRIENVRILQGDWEKCLNRGGSLRGDPIGFVFDPPYSHESRYDGKVNLEEVQERAENLGKNPKHRVVVCGLEEDFCFDERWSKYKWDRKQGGQASNWGSGPQTTRRETIWASPYCLPSFQLEKLNF